MNTVTTKKDRLTIYVDPGVKADLEKLSELEDRTVSNFVEVTLKRTIATAKKEGKIK